MYVLDLFSGIGGFSLGLERAGMRTVAFCEIEPYCRKVLARHWPTVPIHHDIKQLDGSQYAGAVDLVCGGYPCQPFSQAGRKQGEADPRHLWPEMHRIIRDVRPRWVICENVSGHVRLGFDQVAAQLEDDGFTVWPFLIPATAVDAPHKRERLWIVAHARREGIQQRRQLDDAEREGCQQGRVVSDGLPEGRKPEGETVADAHGKPPVRVAIARQECDSWPAEPAVPRVAHGVPDRSHRIRALGNAVVPQIPELIGRSILAYEQQLGMAA